MEAEDYAKRSVKVRCSLCPAPIVKGQHFCVCKGCETKRVHVSCYKYTYGVIGPLTHWECSNCADGKPYRPSDPNISLRRGGGRRSVSRRGAQALSGWPSDSNNLGVTTLGASSFQGLPPKKHRKRRRADPVAVVQNVPSEIVGSSVASEQLVAEPNSNKSGSVGEDTSVDLGNDDVTCVDKVNGSGISATEMPGGNKFTLVDELSTEKVSNVEFKTAETKYVEVDSTTILSQGNISQDENNIVNGGSGVSNTQTLPSSASNTTPLMEHTVVSTQTSATTDPAGGSLTECGTDSQSAITTSGHSPSLSPGSASAALCSPDLVKDTGVSRQHVGNEVGNANGCAQTVQSKHGSKLNIDQGAVALSTNGFESESRSHVSIALVVAPPSNNGAQNGQGKQAFAVENAA